MIPVKEGTEFNQLGQSSLACFQACWKEIKLFILDEKSMVGRSRVGCIDHHLRQADPQNADEILGGMSAIFFGDFAQLPPVGDSPMYSDKQAAYHTALHAEGCHVFESFNQSVTLKLSFIKLEKMWNKSNSERHCSDCALILPLLRIMPFSLLSSGTFLLQCLTG
jgi:hypothetical protein